MQRFDTVRPEYFLFKEKHKMEDDGKIHRGKKKGGELEDRVEWKLGGTMETLVRLHRLQISELTGVCEIKKG